MPDPDLLLLDEPGASLDLGARETLIDDLTSLAASARPEAIVLVSHHVEEIPPGFRHALVLAGGIPVAAGPIETVLTDEVLTPRLRDAHRRRVARRASLGTQDARGRRLVTRDMRMSHRTVMMRR